MKDMKEIYTIPDMEIIQFEGEDVVTSSNDLPVVPFSQF